MSENDMWILRYSSVGKSIEWIANKMGMTQDQVREVMRRIVEEARLAPSDVGRPLDLLISSLVEQHRLLGEEISKVSGLLSHQVTMEELYTALRECADPADCIRIVEVLKTKFVLLHPLPKESSK